MPSLVSYSWLIPLLPLLGAAVAGFLGAKYLRGQSHWPIWLGVGGSAVISLVISSASPPPRPTDKPSSTTPPHATQDAAGEHADTAAEPEAAEHAGPDGRVRSYTSRWYTWIGIGNPAERGQVGRPVEYEQAVRDPATGGAVERPSPGRPAGTSTSPPARSSTRSPA